jgi:hypothetical protein
MDESIARTLRGHPVTSLLQAFWGSQSSPSTQQHFIHTSLFVDSPDEANRKR